MAKATTNMSNPGTCPHHPHMVDCVKNVQESCRARGRTYTWILGTVVAMASGAIAYSVEKSNNAVQTMEVHKAESDAVMKSVQKTVERIEKEVIGLRDR